MVGGGGPGWQLHGDVAAHVAERRWILLWPRAAVMRLRPAHELPNVVVVGGVALALRGDAGGLRVDLLPEEAVQQFLVGVLLGDGRLPLHQPRQLRLRQLVHRHPRDLEPRRGVRAHDGAVARLLLHLEALPLHGLAELRVEVLRHGLADRVVVHRRLGGGVARVARVEVVRVGQRRVPRVGRVQVLRRVRLLRRHGDTRPLVL
mmetsp:Transcript_29222/g.63870  ORF Transcript_29222/g.63870 Transcript_29222/m.63870 type:complete len:204 (+) Transcript_29222:1435-2046(+)